MHGMEAEFQPLTEDWRDCHGYLWGIDLFNAGYYWEAHEAWEGVWHAAGRSGPLADFLKGLIKLAAAGVKAREGSSAGLHRHADRAAELFAGCSQSLIMGLRPAALETAARLLAASDVPRTHDGIRAATIFDFSLRPQ